ncbi:DNA (cytosine-5)-methyltransferase [Exaiptasia diaphana]|nr:DNA (cytosine-5)-methyltransferase [Exaiptasia diaphana]
MAAICEKSSDSTFRVVEFYSGIGGMHFAAKGCGFKTEVVAALEINNTANVVYKHNFPDVKLLQRNIEGLTVKDLDGLAADIFLMSPPCQPFTRVGLQGDSSDPRTKSFLHLMDLILRMSRPPDYLLMENVKGFETSHTRSSFYHRISLEFPTQGLDITCLPRENLINFTLKHNRRNRRILAEFLEPEHDDYFQQFLLPERVLSKFALVLDIVTPFSTHSCCFTKAYGHYAEGTGSILKMADIDDVEYFDKYRSLDPGQSDSQRAEVLRDLKLRYFTPREVANIMYFPKSFGFPEGTTSKQKYRLLGNSLNVHVVTELLRCLLHNS